MMIGCVVGRDRVDADERVAEWRALTGQDGSPGIAGTIDEVAEQLRAYEAAGVERAMLQHLVHEDVEMVEVLGELAAELG
jgi:alkanesulfonate monooxygenase SsuD/methylene tetrahydromethanopterin reductase-like flavin-dependent oxidoreductase (luciferase family)